MNRFSYTLFGVLAASTLTLSCLDVGSSRADYDTTIGKSESGSASVEVAGGLASVQAFSPEETELWSQAPSLLVTLEIPAGEHRIRARNSLATARWTVVGPDGNRVPVQRVEESLTTVQTAVFNTTGGTVTARLAAAPRAADETWRFVAVADIQDRLDDVQDIYDVMRADPTIEFGVISGDLTEQGSRDELREFQRQMEALPFPLYATLGNHELGNGEHIFQDTFGRVNFSFVHRGVRFTMLDSASATLSPRSWDWLQGWLEEGQDQAHVVAMHIAPFDPAGIRNGAWASREEAAAFSGDLGRADVDVAIYGHIHSYYAYESAGVPSYITGGGGAIPQRFDGVGRHYLAIDVTPSTQRFQVGLVRVD